MTNLKLTQELDELLPDTLSDYNKWRATQNLPLFNADGTEQHSLTNNDDDTFVIKHHINLTNAAWRGLRILAMRYNFMWGGQPNVRAFINELGEHPENILLQPSKELPSEVLNHINALSQFVKDYKPNDSFANVIQSVDA